MFKPNSIIQGDCLKLLKNIPQESIDLIYLDPPFFSQKNYDMPFSDKKSVAAFKDSTKAYEEMDVDNINKSLNIRLIHSDNDFWKRDEAGLLRYLAYMKDRLKECHRILKSTGSIYLHCDWHASHYLKIVMDEIFGYENFRNSIIWRRGAPKSNRKQGSKQYGRSTDELLFYTKTKEYTFNTQYSSYNQSELNNKYKYSDSKGCFCLHPLDGPGGASKGNAFYEFKGIKKYWRYSKENMVALEKEGKIYLGKNAKVPMKKVYLEDNKGCEVQNLWDDIGYLSSQAKERLGYPTQKPEALLERIIKASSNQGDLVLDPFCGCGTTLAVAAMLKRNFIGIDISPIACKVMKERLRKTNNLNIPIIQTDYTLEDTDKMDWYEFQQWACNLLLAVPGGKGADRGVDGEGELNEKERIIPFLVQSKKWKSMVGDDRVRAFKGAMDNKETPYGIIVANRFSSQAIKQANDYHSKKQATIHLIETKELLNKNFDIKEKTKWNIIAPDYSPWKKKDKDLTEWSNL